MLALPGFKLVQHVPHGDLPPSIPFHPSRRSRHLLFRHIVVPYRPGVESLPLLRMDFRDQFNPAVRPR